MLRESLQRKSHVLRFSSVVSRVAELVGIVMLALPVSPKSMLLTDPVETGVNRHYRTLSKSLFLIQTEGVALGSGSEIFDQWQSAKIDENRVESLETR